VPAPANIHLIVGEDDYLAEATARKIVEAAVPADLRGSAVEEKLSFAPGADAALCSAARRQHCHVGMSTYKK
jgi:hypothetical protein